MGVGKPLFLLRSRDKWETEMEAKTSNEAQKEKPISPA